MHRAAAAAAAALAPAAAWHTGQMSLSPSHQQPLHSRSLHGILGLGLAPCPCTCPAVCAQPNLALVAENGCYLRLGQGQTWSSMPPGLQVCAARHARVREQKGLSHPSLEQACHDCGTPMAPEAQRVAPKTTCAAGRVDKLACGRT